MNEPARTRTPRFGEALRCVLGCPGRRPRAASAAFARRLDAAFERLRAPDSPLEAVEAEDLIWALWTSHEDPAVEARMEQAVAHLAAREFGAAEAVLDALIADRPDYAEAWNKRATLHFLAGDDARSVDDVIRTLELEPRHFGALAGLGQICLRHGRRGEALAAFEAALAANPRLAGVREAVAALAAGFGRSAH